MHQPPAVYKLCQNYINITCLFDDNPNVILKISPENHQFDSTRLYFEFVLNQIKVINLTVTVNITVTVTVTVTVTKRKIYYNEKRKSIKFSGNILHEMKNYFQR